MVLIRQILGLESVYLKKEFILFHLSEKTMIQKNKNFTLFSIDLNIKIKVYLSSPNY